MGPAGGCRRSRTVAVIEVKHLRVDYDEVNAVQDLTVHIPRGQIYGLVGPNGAGKTSTIKVLAGVLEPTYGTVCLNGRDLEVERAEALGHVGYMPDFPPVYKDLKVWEYLDVFAAAYGIPAAENRPGLVNEWVRKVGLGDKRDAMIKGLSRGMRQRLVLAKTLLPRPSILLLDEPASGLDPIARKQMRDLLKEAARNGASIIISSHILAELSGFCDAIGILEKGRLVESGPLDEIRNRMGEARTLRVGFLDDESLGRFWNLIDEWQIARDQVICEGKDCAVSFSRDDQVAAEFLTRLTARGGRVTHFSLEQDDIEDIFFKVGAKEVS